MRNQIIYITLALALIIISAPAAQAQHPAVTDFYQHYKDEANVHNIKLDGGIFKLLSWIASWDASDEEAVAVKRITENINGIDLIVIPKKVEGRYKFADVKSQVKKDNFDELMNIREKGSIINFYAQGKENEVRDMIIFIDESDEYVIISLKGILDLNDLKYLAEHHKELK